MDGTREEQDDVLPISADRRFGGYVLERPIGRGGMAEVWLGRHEASRGLAAIKILRSDTNHEARALFDRERRAVLMLRHPNIVPVYEVSDDYIICAYVEGVDLRHRMRSPMKVGDAVHIVSDIGSALAAAHDSNVVHCDVKPANILLDRSGNAFLTDFGIARILGDSSQASAEDVSSGTPAYMAPEQASGIALPASDQYSLARTLTALIVGVSLPRAPADALAKLPQNLSTTLKPILFRAMSMVPEARYPSIREFIDALRSVVAAESDSSSAYVDPIRPVEAYLWARHPKRVERIGESVYRADYRLSDLEREGLVDAEAVRAFKQQTGYTDFGWSMYARYERIGPITEPSSLARASESVLLLHGLFTNREVWRDVAVGVARDNGLAIVLTPDLISFGESPMLEKTERRMISPEALVRGVKTWQEILGLGGMPTVALGHSFTATSLLCSPDAEIGEGVFRICVSPVLFFHSLWLRVFARFNGISAWALAFLPKWVWRRFIAFLFRHHHSFSRVQDTARMAMVKSAGEFGCGRFSALSFNMANARPAPVDELQRCIIVTTPDDPLVPHRDVERAIKAAGISERQCFRLIYGGHFPQLLDEENPGWGARNVQELISVIDSVLDMTVLRSFSSESKNLQSESAEQSDDIATREFLK